MIEFFEILIIIVFNKVDLYDEEDDIFIFGGLKVIYNDIGYEVLFVLVIIG